MKEQVEKYLIEYNQLLKDLEETGDYNEFKDQIIQLEQRSQDIVNQISMSLEVIDEEIASRKRKIEFEKESLKTYEERKENWNSLLITLIENTGEELGKNTKRVFSNSFKYYVQKYKSVKENLTISSIPREYVRIKLTENLDYQKLNEVQKILGNKIKYKEEIDKTGLANYAKDNGLEEQYLEEKPFLVKR